VTAPLEMLRRVTRDMAVTSELPVLLDSIASALAEHTGAVFVRVFLYQTDEECDVCRARVGAGGGEGVKRLHLRADRGDLQGILQDQHALPIDSPAPPGKVARERKPFLTNDLLAAVKGGVPEELFKFYEEIGVVAAGARPLEFRGELMGVIGMLSRRPFDPQEFELLGIFADQAAVAIKSAHLFAELGRYKERLQVENAYLQEEIRAEHGFEEIVGQSTVLRSVLRKVKQVAPVDTTVLLTGETGPGKELIARDIHKRSHRSAGPFVAVNCAAIPSSLMASELFGHEKGAFTGALQRRQGRFELADGGTIFLDEVGELPAETQIMLLRVLQEREFERVGGSSPIRVNVRVLAATNRDLQAAVADGTFRADLFYRLNVFPLDVPALRERRPDISLLVEYFIHRYATRIGKRIRCVSKETSQLLQSYDWPGNIRELQNVIERAVIVCDSDTLSIDARWLSGRSPGTAPVASFSTCTLATNEKDAIEAALTDSKGRVAGPFGAAVRLDVPASTLESKIKALKIDKRRFKPG
jgi:formate hydrogenlyase transcriptional activator